MKPTFIKEKTHINKYLDCIKEFLFFKHLPALFFKFVCLFCLFERQRTEKAERGGKRESQAGSVISAQSSMQGLNSQTMRLSHEPKPSLTLN